MVMFNMLRHTVTVGRRGRSRGTAFCRGLSQLRWSSSYPVHELFHMPALSPTMESGSISKWNLGVGDAFGAGDSLCEVQTDKATVDFEAQDDGVLAKILVPDGTDDIAVGVPICVVVEDAVDVAAFADFTVATGDGNSTVESASTTAASTTTTTTATAMVSHALGEFVLMPSARHNSQSRGLDATVLYPGSGKDGRVTKGDFLTAIQNNVAMPTLSDAAAAAATTDAAADVTSVAAAADTVVAAPSPASTAAAAALPTTPPPPLSLTPLSVADASNPFTDVSNNNMRKIIAKRLTESKAEVPHFYTTHSVQLDEVLALRKRLAALDLKFSVNDAIVRASALALRDVPEMNASYDTKTGTVQNAPRSVDISIAVATPAGLITPIVTNADGRGLVDISGVVRDLATRARDNKLLPEEYQGGSFTISNLGMFGIHQFSAVINPPQCAILAVGGGIATIVPTPYDEHADVQPKVEVRTVMEATLSADRRVVDEATAGLFLQTLGYYLSKPELLVL